MLEKLRSLAEERERFDPDEPLKELIAALELLPFTGGLAQRWVAKAEDVLGVTAHRAWVDYIVYAM